MATVWLCTHTHSGCTDMRAWCTPTPAREPAAWHPSPSLSLGVSSTCSPRGNDQTLWEAFCTFNMQIKSPSFQRVAASAYSSEAL